MNKTLGTLQILLALLFVLAGASKFVMPVDQMTQMMPTRPSRPTDVSPVLVNLRRARWSSLDERQHLSPAATEDAIRLLESRLTGMTTERSVAT